jgi:hypothetical protein
MADINNVPARGLVLSSFEDSPLSSKRELKNCMLPIRKTPKRLRHVWSGAPLAGVVRNLL